MRSRMKIILFIILLLAIAGCGKAENAIPKRNDIKLNVWIEECDFSKIIMQNANVENILFECNGVGNNRIESYLTEAGNTALEAWVGEYKFDEGASGPPPMVMEYEIEIYEEEGRYFAEIEQMGQTTAVSAKAEISGNEDEICLLFREYLPDHVIGLNCEKGDIVLKFAKENGELHTYWGEMGPMLYEHEESGRIYFVKEADHIPEELSAWLGEYTFSEISTDSECTFERLDYRIRIYQENDQFFAEVQVDEEKPYIREKADVRGNKDEIRLLLIETLPGHACEFIYEERSILLKLKNENGKILTEWGMILPMGHEYWESGKVYFEKVE
ncbi:MAG: hypothetical protein HDR00_04615 [Lachnospiraceae bacterium]|nr:hypothetical protein [Lachnospiraceae bacterium]